MKSLRFVFTLIVASFFLFACTSEIKVKKVNDLIVDQEALTIKGNFGQAINGKSFQQDAMVTHKDYQYLGYYNANRHVCIARRQVQKNEWEIIEFDDYNFRSNDAHNTISIGICPNDGTIHMAFDHHGHPLHYRASVKDVANDPDNMEWSASLFGEVTSELEKGKSIRITYPRFWQTPDGGLQFCYRRGGSGNGDRMLVDYNANRGEWENTRQIDSGKGLFTDKLSESETRCSYPNGYTYDSTGKLHATWVWRESSQGANHDLIYVYSEDGGISWKNNSGNVLPEPPHVNSPDIIAIPIGREYGLMNTHGQDVDSKNRIHTVIWHCSDQTLKEAGSAPGEHRWGPPEARRYHHYWRETNGNWHHTEIPWVAGNRPKLFIDNKDNIVLIFANNQDSSLLMKNVEGHKGDLIIAVATADTDYNDWKAVHVEPGPFVNEMLGDYYRWKSDGILSVMVQEFPEKEHQATPLRVIDFKID